MADGLPIAGTLSTFREVELISADAAPRRVLAADLAPDVLSRLADPRPALAGLTLDRPRIMGIVNVTPDSFSDGGRLEDAAAGVRHGLALAAAGADILDIGGESTRPGAEPVTPDAEAARVVPVIAGLRAAGHAGPISIDTRNAATARAALEAGANIVNDVSGLGHDPEMAPLVAKAGCPVILMHMRGTPATMRELARYDNVVVEVMDELARCIAAAEAAGIARGRIVADPGIGFAKTAAHNLELLRHLSVVHDLGVAVLLGVSRKRFIGELGDEPDAAARAPGSIAAGLAGLDQGAHLLRVHDVAETRQALGVWLGMRGRDER